MREPFSIRQYKALPTTDPYVIENRMKGFGWSEQKARQGDKFDCLSETVHHTEPDEVPGRVVTTTVFVGECYHCKQEGLLVQQSWDEHIKAMNDRGDHISSVPAMCLQCGGWRAPNFQQ